MTKQLARKLVTTLLPPAPSPGSVAKPTPPPAPEPPKPPEWAFATELRLTHYVATKLEYLANKGSTEVALACFTDPSDPLLVIDAWMFKQTSEVAHWDMAPDGMSLLMLDTDKSPSQFSFIQVHSHPSSCAEPSTNDWKHLKEWTNELAANQSNNNYRIMLIFGRNRAAGNLNWSCHIRINCGPTSRGFSVITTLDVKILPPAPTDLQYITEFSSTWDSEYARNVTIKEPISYYGTSPYSSYNTYDHTKGAIRHDAALWDADEDDSEFHSYWRAHRNSTAAPTPKAAASDSDITGELINHLDKVERLSLRRKLEICRDYPGMAGEADLFEDDDVQAFFGWCKVQGWDWSKNVTQQRIDQADSENAFTDPATYVL